MKTTIPNRELALLESTIGSTLLYFGGPSMPYFLASHLVIFGTSTCALKLEGTVVFDDLQGFPNEFSQMRIAFASKEEVRKTFENGNQYFFHKGEQILDVQVIEETVRATIEGKSAWEFATDLAVIFQLTGGAISVSKLGHHDEVLEISHARELLGLKMSPTAGRFEDDLLIQHQFERRTLTLSEALQRATS